jgi:transposase InsO family protein
VGAIEKRRLEVNKKRVQRLWREAGLRVPAKVRKRRRLGTSENGCTRRRRAKYIDHVWSYDDFAMDTTEDGRRLKVMPIVDEYSRECLALQMERSITAEDVVETLAVCSPSGASQLTSALTTVPSSQLRR